MKNFLASLAALAFILFAPAAFAQGFTIPDNSVQIGHMTLVPSLGKTAPTGAGCTIAAGSSDGAGTCTASAASGSITFAVAFNSAPSCLLVDENAAGGAGGVPVYAVSTTAITLTTIVSTHIMHWFCVAKTGG